MNEPLVSIIVPVYNVESYLSPCLESIQRQSWRNLEVLMVDDGSTDGSSAVCAGYGGGPIPASASSGRRTPGSPPPGTPP